MGNKKQLTEPIFYKCVGDKLKLDTNRFPDGPTYILRDGKMIDIDDFYNTVKHNKGFKGEWDIPYHMFIQDYIEHTFGYTYTGGNCDDFIMDVLGGIRCNDGSMYDDLYVDLPANAPSSSQYNTLCDWIDSCIEQGTYAWIDISCGGNYQKYYFDDYDGYDIVKKIKRYYASGRFYENVQKKHTLDENLFKDVVNH